MSQMNVYIAISIVVLAIIAASLFLVKGKVPQAGLSKPAALAFPLIIAGIIFGENRLIGYGLLGSGVALAIIDVVIKLKNKQAN